MFCTKCGKQLKGTENFCPDCGVKINRKEAPNSRLKTGAGVGLVTQVAVTVLFYYIIFILLLTCTPADEKGFRIAMIICFVPILLLCVWIIIGSTDYIIVEGNQFCARRNFKKVHVSLFGFPNNKLYTESNRSFRRNHLWCKSDFTG